MEIECDWCGDDNGEFYVGGFWMCESCKRDEDVDAYGNFR